MAYYAYTHCYISFLMLMLFFLFSCLPFHGYAQSQTNLPLKAVNLGNWLVNEGWMKPSLYDNMPNNDLLDGTQVQLKSTKLNKYLCSENGGGDIIVANRPSASGWETFSLWRINESTFSFRVFNKQFAGLQNQGQGNIVAISTSPGKPEAFQIVRKADDKNRVRIQAQNGLFLQAQSETVVTADYNGGLASWGDDDPSVFQMEIVRTLQGEYQITNGYGQDEASKVLQNHWDTYITEEDFKFMSENGLNAVRIPVGWWIAYGKSPPMPFVGGSVDALDKAFTWAGKYGMKVIIDLHAVNGSQNGNEHSAARDSHIEWGDSQIQNTVFVIDFLASRYAKNPSLAAIELMNEPVAPNVNLDTLKKYYKAGYDAVRKYSDSVFVILSNRLSISDPTELISFASSLKNVVIDVHYYNLYSDMFKSMNVEQHIDYLNTQRSSDINTLTTSNGPLVLVGEWTCEWDVRGASMEEYQRFGRAQLQVYGRASFGWAYWSYKNVQNHWSLKWMIENNYINLNAS